jgi:stage V sporulation protein G
MTISELQIIPIKANNGLIAIANLVIDNNIYLNSIGIHKKLNSHGYRLTYPTKKIGDKNINIYHPINKQCSQIIEKTVFKKLEELFG